MDMRIFLASFRRLRLQLYGQSQSTAKIVRQRWLCLDQDLEDGAPVGSRQGSIRRGLVFPAKHFPQALVERILCRRRQSVKRTGINQKTARMAEQPALQVHLPQRSPLAVLGSSRLEFCAIWRGTCRAIAQLRLIRE